jgi:hypothetical protein
MNHIVIQQSKVSIAPGFAVCGLKNAEYKKWRMFQSINPWHIVSIEIAIWVTRCKRHYSAVAWGSSCLFNQPLLKITTPLTLYGTQ